MRKELEQDDNAKAVNPNEKRELQTMREQIHQLRYQTGLTDEQIAELQNAKQQTLQAIGQHKQAFRDRVINIAKSYGIDLGTAQNGLVWSFDENTFSFVASEVTPALPAPNGKPSQNDTSEASYSA